MKGFTFSCLSFDFSLSGSSSHFLLSAFCHRGLRWSRWSRRHYRRFHSTNCHYLQCFSQARNWDYAVIVFTPALRSSGFTLSHLLTFLHSPWTRTDFLAFVLVWWLSSCSKDSQLYLLIQSSHEISLVCPTKLKGSRRSNLRVLISRFRSYLLVFFLLQHQLS